MDTTTESPRRLPFLRLARRRRQPPPVVPIDPGLVPWLLASAVATLAPHALHTAAWQIVLTAALLVWRGLLWRLRAALPPRWLMLPLTIAAVAGIAFEHRRLFGQDSGVALLLAFMALKLMETRTARDARVIVMLGYFLLLTHYFYQDGIPTGAWMIVALTVVTATLIRIETAALDARALLRRAAFMLAQSLPVMAVLFVLFPRVDGPLWGLPQESRRDTTGLSDTMSPGSISQLTQSGEIAFRVQFDGAAPAYDQLYWRGPVMTYFDGTTWRGSRGGPSETKSMPEAIGTARYRYTMTLEPHQQRWLLALDMPTVTPRDSRFDGSYALTRRRSIQERFRYEAESAPAYRIGVDEAGTVLYLAKALPRGRNPRTLQMMQRWRAEAANEDVLIERVLAHFRNEPFAYTLQPPPLGEHPVDDFLFRTRRGFCEHYASAFATMMRAAGIPARVVGGYQGGTPNPVDDYWVIRQADAHAWTEVWLAGRGWVRIDPTAAIAPSRIEQGIAAAAPATEALPGVVRGGLDWLREARFRWEAINNAWNQWVLGYDQTRQLDLLGRLGLPSAWQALIGGLVVTAAAAVLLLALWATRRDRSRDPAARLWDRFNRRMAKRGLPREPWEGPYDYGRRLAATRPEAADAILAFCAAYARWRYADARPQDLATMNQQLKLLA